MSFYVDTQEEALKIGLSHFRPDLAKLTLEQIKGHPDVKVFSQRVTNPLDVEGELAQEVLSLDVKGVPVLLMSGPFRSGYDIWAFSRENGMGMRIGP